MNFVKMSVLSSSEELYQCAQCSYQTEWAFEIDHHFQTIHLNVDAAQLFNALMEPQHFACIWCDFTTNFKMKLYEHSKLNHSEGRNEDTSVANFNCYQCHRCKFKTYTSLQGVNHYILCKNASDSNIDDASHPKIVVEYKCTKCPYRGRNQTHLSNHMLAHETDGKIEWIECSQCSYRTKRNYNMTMHKLTHAAASKINWFQCDTCSFRTKFRCELTRHRRANNLCKELFKAKGMYECLQCLYKTTNKRNFVKHKRTLCVNASRNMFKAKGMYECLQCLYKTTNKTNFVEHKKTWCVNASRYNCKQCSYTTHHVRWLKEHMLEHVAAERSKLPPVKCSYKVNVATERSKLPPVKCSYKVKIISIKKPQPPPQNAD